MTKKEDLETLRHSVAHLLAAAVMELYPGTKRTIGPAVENGFYYDFEFKKPLHEDELRNIEKKMRQILPSWDKFERQELSIEKARKEFKDNKFKLELIDEFSKTDKKLSFYKSGNYVDLCKGGHVLSAKDIKSDAFKLTHIAGAYWRGDEKNKQLTRIYGLAFSSNKELKEHLHLLEEAKKRDHRVISKKLDLISFHEQGPGMPFFHSKGAYIFDSLIDYVSSTLRKRNYQLVKTPLILSDELWKQSGHWDHFHEQMYFTKIDDRDFAVKPMNCPGHVLIYKTSAHSYRELPIKMGEFGLVHRHELSGVISGLFRVRSFIQDDAHIFCTKEQINEQVSELLDLAKEIYSTFGFEYNVELSTKPEKAMGSSELWELAESTLKKVLKEKKIKYKLNDGDGAFYGPKIDYHLKDAIGRTWQCGTIQLDFQMPEKFELNYEGADGQKHRPVMIHRTILGSVERFMGILIEHYAGRFPLWLAPEQVRIVTVSDKFNEYANSVAEKLRKNDVRVHVDERSESISKKVREAQIQYVPLILTVGEKEVSAETLAVRTLDGKVKFGMKVDEFILKVTSLIESRDIKLEI